VPKSQWGGNTYSPIGATPSIAPKGRKRLCHLGIKKQPSALSHLKGPEGPRLRLSLLFRAFIFLVCAGYGNTLFSLQSAFQACFDFPIQRAALIVFSSKAFAALCDFLFASGRLLKSNGCVLPQIVMQI
jgi:hypothetical protein